MEKNDTESDDESHNQNPNATSEQHLVSTSNLTQPFQTVQNPGISDFHHLQNPNIRPDFNRADPTHQQTSVRNWFTAAAVRGNVLHSRQFAHHFSWNIRPTYSYAFQQLYSAMNPAEIQTEQGVQHPCTSFYPRNIPAQIDKPQSSNLNQELDALSLVPVEMSCDNPQHTNFPQSNPTAVVSQQQPTMHPTPFQLPTQTHNVVQGSSVQTQFSGNVLDHCTVNIAGHNINSSEEGKQPLGKEESGIGLSTVKNFLKRWAQRRCSSKNFLELTGQQIEICPMDITDQACRKLEPAIYQKILKLGKLPRPSLYCEEDGHYNRRKDYENINFKKKSNVEVESLFKLAEQQGTQSIPERHGNVVALIGQPGIGKTTLSKVITENIFNNKMENVRNIDWVFYISVNSIDFESPVTLMDFLLKCSNDNTQYTKLNGTGYTLLQENILKDILESENVFIAFDGLDEASTNWNLGYKAGLNLREKNNPLLYLFGLMNGDILPKAKKLFTSRQNHFFSIDKNCRPSFVAEVLGLNTKSQESLCKQICPDKKDEVWKIIKSNPNLSYSCYVPAKCIFIVYAIWKSLEDSGQRFHSLTHIFAYGFKHYFASDFIKGATKDETYMDKIAKLAWNGFKMKQIVFDELDLDNVGIDIKTFSDVLSAFVTEENWAMKFLNCDRKSNFSHLIWQEYFAACYLVYFSSVDEFSELISQFTSDRWEVVAKFLFGLFNSEVTKVAKACFLTTNQSKQEFQVKKEKLLELARDEMKVRAKSTDTMSASKLVQVCSWMQEINDKEFYEEVVTFLPQSLVLDGSILLTDVSSVAEMLSHSQSKHNITIERKCKFSHGSLQVFFQNLERHKIQIKALKLRWKNLDDKSASAIALFVHDIEELCLHHCNLTSVGVCKIAEAISNLLQPAKSLSLGWNKIDDKTAFAIAACIHNVKELNLQNCKLSSAGICIIANAVSHLSQPIKLLNLSSNKVSNESATAIASCMCNIKELNLWGCQLTGVGICHIAHAILNLPQPVKALNLGLNKFTDESASAIASCIHNIETLTLTSCQLSSAQICEIAKAILSISRPVKSLNLGMNKVNGESASAIVSCVYNIETLSLESCQMTCVDICKIANAISNLQRPMRKLILFGNSIDEEAEKCLFSCLHNIQDELIVRKSFATKDFESKYMKIQGPKPVLTIFG